MGGFDFDHWKHLAERDPAGFFQARDAALREWIARQGQVPAGKGRARQGSSMAQSPLSTVSLGQLEF